MLGLVPQEPYPLGSRVREVPLNLTPIDVEQKAFTQALRGYQMDEVDDFLDEVVATLRSYEQRLREAQDKIRAVESAPAGTQAGAVGDESEISRAILTAQRTADRMLADARAEAETILKQAEAETSAALERRDAERSRLDGEVSGMRDLVGSLRSQLVALATAVGGHVDEMDSNLQSTSRSLAPMADAAETAEVAEIAAGADEGENTEADAPTFSDIFGGNEEVDITDSELVAAEPEVARASSRPWERG